MCSSLPTKGYASLWRAGFLIALTLDPLVALAAQRSRTLWPVFHSPPREAPDTSQTDVLYPLIRARSAPGESELGFHPLFHVASAEGGTVRQTQALWPIFNSSRKPGDHTDWLLPFYWRKKVTKPDGTTDEDFFVFPLFFGGRTGDKSHFAFFPIAGRLEGALGRRQVSFFLFPLYCDAEAGEHETRNVLFPVWHLTKGEDKRGWHIWPFYGQMERPGKEKAGFVLWPFVTFSKSERADGKGPEAIFFCPFYGRYRSPQRTGWTLLWPFCSSFKNEKDGGRELNMPWPIVSIVRKPNYSRTITWPFWAETKQPGSVRTSVCWPLFRWHEQERKGTLKTEFSFLPILSVRKEQSVQFTSRSTVLWPLLRYDADSKGNRRFRLLSLLWFRDPDGFDRNYADFWRIWCYDRSADGTKTTDLLWHFYYHRRKGDDRVLKIGPLLTVERGAGASGFSVLCGLFAKRREGTKRTVRVFFVPFSRDDD